MYNVAINNVKGNWKLIECQHISQGVECEACGHPINNIYTIKNGNKIMNVGSECLLNILGQKEGLKLAKAIKSIENKIRTQYNRPLKYKQLKNDIEKIKGYLDNYQYNKLLDSIKFQDDIDSWSPDSFQKIIKGNGGVCKFSFSKEEKEILKILQTKAINEYIANNNIITDIKILKELEE